MDPQPTRAVVTAPVVGRDVHARLAGARPQANADAPPFWGEDGFGFDDLIDLVNPLQHIPIVGAIYRALSGDTIAFGPRVLGGALFSFGPIGAAAGAATAAFNGLLEYETGKDAGAHVLAWLDQGGDEARAVAEIDGLPWRESREPVAVVAAMSRALDRYEALSAAPAD